VSPCAIKSTFPLRFDTQRARLRRWNLRHSSITNSCRHKGEQANTFIHQHLLCNACKKNKIV
jgi:hypothetical protein